MYSFEGEFKRRPIQSLGGASRQKREEKDALLQRTQLERLKREEHKRRINSTICIQSWYRACKIRHERRKVSRTCFATAQEAVDKGKSTLEDGNTLEYLLQHLLFCYRDKYDNDKLLWLCQQLVRNKDPMVQHITKADKGESGFYHITGLLVLCCRYLNIIASSPSPIAIPMRMLEIYCTADTYRAVVKDESKCVPRIVLRLVQNGFFSCLRNLLDCKVPNSLERSAHPPTPVASSILKLIVLPFQHLSMESRIYRSTVLQCFCREILKTPYSEQVLQFLIPALAKDTHSFPFLHLLEVLLPANVCVQARDVESPPAHDLFNWHLTVESTSWFMYTFLQIGQVHIGTLSSKHIKMYLLVLQKLVITIDAGQSNHNHTDSDPESDDEETMDTNSQSDGSISSAELRGECLRLLDQPSHVRGVVPVLAEQTDPQILTAFCSLCHTLMMHNRMTLYRTRLFYSLAFNPQLLKMLWYTCISLNAKAVTGSEVPLLMQISRASTISQSDVERILPLLSVFCSLFSHTLVSLHDSEFYAKTSSDNSSMPFSLEELRIMSLALRDACLGIVELAHPDTKPALRDDYIRAFASVGVNMNLLSSEELHRQRRQWAYLFRVMGQLVKQLYSRDSRRSFCPEGHWLASQLNIHADKLSQLYKEHGAVFVKRSFGTLSALNVGKPVDEELPRLTTNEVRTLTILTELPFVVTFQERVKILQRLIVQDKLENQGEGPRHFAGGPYIDLLVRRNYLYEDAFEKLSPENEPNLKLRVQVQLVNFAGLDEAGIDGGGIFREFMTELIKTSYDPNRGLFKYTHDKLLYPNPQASMILDNYVQHYFFLGRILGKTLYENMLVEMPFASFFLSKLLSRHRGDVDIHHLASLDPVMYKNLLYLKNYSGDVTELGLDFTVVNNDLGETQVEELKPGGRDIVVDNHNRIEYIHLMADYKLNKQIRVHCNAFRQGLADVVNLEWLRMFDHHELQNLISGAEVPIDISDLRRNTNYSGGYHDEHPVIRNFWNVVSEFSDVQKRQLLKFVTSCSRPPLLGFKELYPAFCVQHAGSDTERLPTASTCMNLLKLPEFKDLETLSSKLSYAIESGAGFELS